MPIKRSPIFQKFPNLLKISLFIAKMKRPMIPRLNISIKKPSKMKNYKLLKHYNYKYVQEYQFSPPNSPLFRFSHNNKPFKKRRSSDINSILFASKCLGWLRPDSGRDGSLNYNYPMENFGLDILPAKSFGDAVSPESMDSGGECDCSIDERAERFIERFYEDMRLQREESFLQINALLEM